MCGIAGKVSFGQSTVTEKALQQMGAAIIHRGPDASGTYVSKDKKVGLSFRRLAIIDLSKRGNQPMSWKGRYWIVFNGEIYNFPALRQELEQIGVNFKSHTDTEVLLALYERDGEQMLERIRGMFSFVIYDEKEGVLFCARDRVGKKPFKYFASKNCFIFASELKAILTQPECPKQVDEVAIHHYLTYQYVPAPRTGFKGISKLEPGHYLKINCKNGKIEKKRYWHLDYSKKLQQTEAEWKAQILAKLDESVRIRMMADVPIGAFLSGGIDSSAVVAMMSRHSVSPIKTFSIGFTTEAYSELPYARMIAEKFKTDHTEFVVKPETIEVLPLLVRHYEEPYADSSALPTYFVSKLTREHVTVALNGDGGDENFAGYSRYSVQKAALSFDRFQIANSFLLRPAVQIANKLFPSTLMERAERFSGSFAQDAARRYVNYICYFTNAQKQQLYSPQLAERMAKTNSEDEMVTAFAEAKTSDVLDQTFYADFTRYLPDDLLAKVDIATMAVSLEGRSPFLDHELLELTAQMPHQLKLKGYSQKKYILKEALRGLIPDEVMFRPKRGFGVPIEHWFREDLAGYAKDTLLSKRAIGRGLFNSEAIQGILERHQQTRVNLANQIWALLTLELWFKEYFD